MGCHPLGKEKGKEEYLYSAFLNQGTHTKRSGMDHPCLSALCVPWFKKMMDHTVLPANNTMPAFPSCAFTRCHHHSNRGSRHPIAAHYSFIDPERMKG